MTVSYESTWRSLRAHATPQWFRDGKFGIYTHWGVYSVPACGPNATWYPYNMYREGTPQHAYHARTYGPPSEFGYKEFIPLFTGEQFDADEWAELFHAAGARFAGPVAEHHDGFAMWDSAHTNWNAARMGPRRDVVGELERAIRGQGMRFLTAFHHAANWWFYPHWRPDFDTSDARYAGLYGELHNIEGDVGPAFFDQEKPSRAFLDQWLAKIVEVIDRYRPDVIWYDFGLDRVQEHYKREALAYYYGRAREWGREVVATYKWHHLAPGAAVVDLELGRMGELTYHDWITDTTVDDGHGWGYVRDTAYKSVTSLVHYLVDNVSKNGLMLLNVGPMPNGTIPEPAKEILRGIGVWLDVNGDAIYGTSPWMVLGEGPTQMALTGAFSERQEVAYTAEDVRFTVKGDVLYATLLGWPGERATVGCLGRMLYEQEMRSVHMLGVERELAWTLSPDGLTVTLPAERPCEHAYVLRIERARPF